MESVYEYASKHKKGTDNGLVDANMQVV